MIVKHHDLRPQALARRAEQPAQHAYPVVQQAAVGGFQDKGAGRLFGLLSPVHPLYVWHYAKFADVVQAQRDRLGERDTKLVTDSARDLPNFLTSLYIPAVALGQGQSLAYAGRVNQLPYYCDIVDGGAGDDGAEAIGELIQGFLALEPHARHGLRIALVDPPDAGPYLREMVKLHDDGKLKGAHIVVYRHDSNRLSLALRLDDRAPPP